MIDAFLLIQKEIEISMQYFINKKTQQHFINKKAQISSAEADVLHCCHVGMCNDMSRIGKGKMYHVGGLKLNGVSKSHPDRYAVSR